MIKNILDYLEYSALRKPDKVAFSDGKTEITFQELKNKGMALGTLLFSEIGTRKNVLILMQRSPIYMIALTGVWYANSCCVPLDDELPFERIKMILQKTEAEAIIYDSNFEEIADNLEINCRIHIESLAAAKADRDVLNRLQKTRIDMDPAYIIFTSGSSGNPKGSILSHRSVINLAEGLCDGLDYQEDEILAGQTPLFYVASLHDIMPALKLSLTAYLIPKKILMFPKKVVSFLKEYHITVLSMIPSVLSHLATYGNLKNNTPENLRKILFGGEVLPPAKYHIWQEACPKAKFYCCYGLTETTTTACFWEANRALQEGEALPIGNAIQNVEVFLLDENNEYSDTEGEICFRGACLSMGYFGESELTDRAFVRNPNCKGYTEIIYRTGDLGEKNAYGEIVFRGRKDSQIKFMGHRVELGDIETVSQQCEGVHKACCIFDTRLYLYYEGELPEHALMAFLKEHLPTYMVPYACYRLPEMPFLANGKINRKQIQNMER